MGSSLDYSQDHQDRPHRYSNVASPANDQFTSQASFTPSSSLQILNSPITFTMSSQEADQEGALTVQSGDMSMSRSVSSSSSSTRVVKTMRTVRRVQIVGGEEIVSEVTSPVEDGVVSIVTGSDGDGTNTLTLTGGELQSATQQMSSYQSSHQTSSSVMRQTSSSEKMSSLSFSQDGELTSTDGTMSVMKQMSGETSSSSTLKTSSSVMRQTSSGEKMLSFSVTPSGEVTNTDGTIALTKQMSGDTSSSLSFTRQESDGSSEMVGDMESMMRQMSEKRQISSSSSSSVTAVRSSQTSVRQISSSSSSSSISKLSGGELTVGDNPALLEQMGNTSSFSQSSQSMRKSEVSSKTMSSSDWDGKMTMSSSMSEAKGQQQSSSVQVMTQSSGDPQQPMTFDLKTLTIGASNGHSLVQSDPESTVEKSMTYSTRPGQMTVGQAVTMQGGGSATDETEDGVQVSMKWQGSASMKQERSVFTSNVTSEGDDFNQLEGLPGQSSQLAITSPEGDSTLGN